MRVQVGSARLTLPSDRVTPGAATARAGSGLVRVDPLPRERDALARWTCAACASTKRIASVEKALDDAARGGVSHLAIVHGVGSGALMSALRAHLRTLPHVARVEAGASDSGGPGVTLAWL